MTSRVETFDTGYLDDAGYTLYPGDDFSGNAGWADQDSVALWMREGETYQLRVVSTGELYPLESILFEGGSALAVSPQGLVSEMTFTAQKTGIHYLTPQFNSAVQSAPYRVFFNDFAGSAGEEIAQLAEYLAFGYAAWRGYDLTVWDNAPGGEVSYKIVDFGADTRDSIETALETWAQATGLTFTPTDGFFADILFRPSTDGTDSTTSENSGTASQRAIVELTEETANDTELGSFGHYVILHELGHALGLGHPGPYNNEQPAVDERLFANDSTAVSIMSYFETWEIDETGGGFNDIPISPMLGDLAAIDLLYGTRTRHASDSYYQILPTVGAPFVVLDEAITGGLPDDLVLLPGVGIQALIDDGGVDTLDFSQVSRFRLLDLAPAGDVLRVDLNMGITLDPDSVIENVILNFADMVQGNDADNRITVLGSAPTVVGGAGEDVLVLPYTRAHYDISQTDVGFFLQHASGVWSDNVDLSEVERVVFTDGELAAADLLSGPGRGVHLTEATATGTGFDDTLFNFAGGGVVDMNAGDDIAVIFAGDNNVRGDSGQDRIVLGTGDDRVDGGSGDDIIQADGVSTFFGGNDRIEGGPGDDLLSGGPGADVFVFAPDEGSNRIVSFWITDAGIVEQGADFDPVVDRIDLNGFVSVDSAWQQTGEGALFSAQNTQILVVGVSVEDILADGLV